MGGWMGLWSVVCGLVLAWLEWNGMAWGCRYGGYGQRVVSLVWVVISYLIFLRWKISEREMAGSQSLELKWLIALQWRRKISNSLFLKARGSAPRSFLVRCELREMWS